jgi:nitrogen fixation-related uncharacterized protein
MIAILEILIVALLLPLLGVAALLWGADSRDCGCDPTYK